MANPYHGQGSSIFHSYVRLPECRGKELLNLSKFLGYQKKVTEMATLDYWRMNTTEKTEV